MLSTLGNIIALAGLIALRYLNLHGCSSLTGNVNALADLVDLEVLDLTGCLSSQEDGAEFLGSRPHMEGHVVLRNRRGKQFQHGEKPTKIPTCGMEEDNVGVSDNATIEYLQAKVLALESDIQRERETNAYLLDHSLLSFVNAQQKFFEMQKMADHPCTKLPSWVTEMKIALEKVNEFTSGSISVLNRIVETRDLAKAYYTVVNEFRQIHQSDGCNSQEIDEHHLTKKKEKRTELLSSLERCCSELVKFKSTDNFIELNCMRAQAVELQQKIKHLQKKCTQCRGKVGPIQNAEACEHVQTSMYSLPSPPATTAYGGVQDSIARTEVEGNVAAAPLCTLPQQLLCDAQCAKFVSVIKFATLVRNLCVTAIEEFMNWEKEVNPRRRFEFLDKQRGTVEALGKELHQPLNESTLLKMDDYHTAIQAFKRELAQIEAPMEELQDPMLCFPFETTMRVSFEAGDMLKDWLRATDPGVIRRSIQEFETLHSDLILVKEPSTDKFLKLLATLHGAQNRIEDTLCHNREKLKTQWSKRQSDLESSSSMSSTMARDFGTSLMDLTEARMDAQAKFSDLEKERRYQIWLVSNHFPEVQLKHEFVNTLALRDAEDHVATNLTFDMYDHSEWPEDTGPENNSNVTYLRVFNGKSCVVKKYQFKKSDFLQKHCEYVREISAMSKLRLPGVVTVDCMFRDPATDTLHIQMPFFSGGNIKQWVARLGHGAPVAKTTGLVDRTAREAWQHYLVPMLSILDALHSLHERQLVHGHLKLENILMNSDGKAILGDVGLHDHQFALFETASAQQEKGVADEMHPGSLVYQAPEVKNGGTPTKHSDMFSFGMCCFFLFGPNLPIPCTQSHLGLIISGVETSDRDFSSLLQLLLLASEPEKRGSALSVADHAMFQSCRHFNVNAVRSGLGLHDQDHVPISTRSCAICGENAPNVTQWVVCGDDAPPDQHDEDPHAACFNCFNCFVLSQTRNRSMNHSTELMRCFMNGCTRRLPHALIAHQTTIQTFSQYQSVYEAALERANQRRIECGQDVEEGKLHALNQSLSDLSNAWNNRREIREHITEQILTLACPRCGQAFIDFSNCCALTCSRDGAAFCAFCLTDCGDDAHMHVANCEFNPVKGSVYVSESQFEKTQRERRKRMLEIYLETLCANDKVTALRDCSIYFEDLGI